MMILQAKQRSSVLREWVEIKEDTKTHDVIHKNSGNPFAMELRVGVASTFQPWVTIIDFDKTDQREPYCGLYGKYGYRYRNSGTNMTIPICVYGLAIDILRYLEDKHEIVAVVYMVRDGLYGSYNKTSGKATGLVREIMDGHADISVDMMEDDSRRKAIEFTSPYEMAHHGIAYIKDNIKVGSGVFSPFSATLWAVIMSVILGLVLLIWAIERLSPFGELQKNRRLVNEPDHMFGISESMEFVWGTFCCGEIIQIKPSVTASRVISIFIACVFIMIVAAYSANLITSFVVVDETEFITGLNDPKILDEKSKYKIGTQFATVTANYLQNHPNYRIRKMSTRIEYYKTYQEAIKDLEKGKIHFFMSDYISLVHSLRISKDCSMRVVKADSSYAPLGFGFKKNSPLKRKIEIAAQSLVSSGKKDRLLKFWFSFGKDSSCRANNAFYELGIHHVANLFILACYAICACFGITLLALIKKRVYLIGKNKKRCISQPEK
eukprot:gene10297-11359_t